MTDPSQPSSGPLTGFLGLSKSKLASFERCPRRLWLDAYRRDLLDADNEGGFRKDAGSDVGKAARTLHPDGVLISAAKGYQSAIEHTRQLLDEVPRKAIFEATFEHNGVLVRLDILEPEGSESWRVAEVKGSTKVKAHHLGDLATQVWVARNAGLSVSSAAIRHVDSSFVLARENEFDGLFRDSELLAEIEDLIASREGLACAALKVLGGSEPATQPGGHCEKPFPCEFSSHCHASLPADPTWPATVLPNGGGKRWLEDGVTDLFEVEPDKLDSQIHRRVYEATVTGEPFYDRATACAIISSWAYPRAWLDFETIAFPVPRWVGTRPYQQVPFQFSVHIDHENEQTVHHEFLSLDGNDPRRPCAEALIAKLPTQGAIIAYNAAFERRCIQDLADAFPDLRRKLEALVDRLVDLLPVVRATWYHRDQRGSWSIKAVLPTVSTGPGYDSLEVRDGNAAQLAYLKAIEPSTTAERRVAIESALSTYCKQDTEAMRVLAKRLVGGYIGQNL